MKISGFDISSDQLPSLLEELDLLALFVRRLIERSNSASIRPSDQEQYNNLQLFLKNEHITSQEDLIDWLNKNQIDEKSLSLKLYRFLQVEKFKEEKFGSQVKNVFLENKDNLDKVMYSIFRTKERAKAVEIHLRIEEQESTFADLASEYSEGIESQLNGLIGPIEMGKINVKIAERLKISQRGHLWEPFQVDNWWVLLRLEKYLPSQLDIPTQKRIINDLYNKWIENEIDSALKDFKSSPELGIETSNDGNQKTATPPAINHEDISTPKKSILTDSSRLESLIKKFPFRRG